MAFPEDRGRRQGHTTATTYLVALGSNRPRSASMPPRQMLLSGMKALNEGPCRILRTASIIETAPVGPALRRFANGAALVSTSLSPPAFLDHLKLLERRFGRKAGRRWGDRTLDLDIILWSGGEWRSRRLSIPHAQARLRDFVLRPAQEIAAGWPVPCRQFRQKMMVRHLLARIKSPKPVDRSPHSN